ncbi:cardiolipin synthase [Dysgonomonas sp. 25]|uniref:cardiolipin synthase n=1 Tax=Dysgonomonas sp. 25 TaxID=2302933 RepID=UPI0013D4E9E0|nr:cardiolipin synthase [Dysgonomonas sp. 25]NDV69738.1 cardiolipin synthase [Dysgonomonas sp. 25]
MIDFTSDNLILFLQLFYVITAIGVIVVIITQNRNPVKTVSWILILVFLPLVGLIIYYFFGEDGRKKRLISHRMFRKLSKKAINRIEPKELIPPPEKYSNLISLLYRMDRAALYSGNKITFYSDGVSKFDALFEEIRKAEHHIHIQYYIFMDDDMGHRLANLLLEKAKQGVTVRLMYDDVGSWNAKRKFFEELQQQGIETQAFLKVTFRFLASRVNYRNHRKIVVIDGKVGFMGGMNVADRYIKGVDYGIWRDNHIKVEGKAVAGLQTSFIIDWNYSRKEFLSDDSYFPKIATQGDNLVQFVTSGPMGQYKSIHIGIIQAIYNAKDYIYIQTPYFVPTDQLMSAIQTAAMRGVDVRLMIPRNSDTTFVHIATMSFIKELQEAGVSVYLFEGGFLHSKMTVIDDSLTITGSANMDVRSFEHNFEIDAFIYNEGSARSARRIFEQDMVMASLLYPEDWAKRSNFRKFAESIVRLFSPLL